ncbi:hypothetical protein [Gloeocapsopsis dulcis]|nr:hypothetical protein [Gloeocapsopsis dulcis]WNN91769.1 hypothetical protein P0S91_12170 [Gloeocapsopsis dulcis]
MIIIFVVEPERQQELIDPIKEYVGVGLQNLGLIFTSFHRSLDGTLTMNY